MEYIKLKDGSRYGLLSITNADRLALVLPAASLDDLLAVFSDSGKTQTMTLETEEGGSMAVFSGYTFVSIELCKDYEVEEETQDAIVVTFAKPDPLMTTLADLSDQMTDTQLALVELYEMIGG